MTIGSDIISGLGAGSGINGTQLAEQLTEVERMPKQDRIDSQREKFETQLSDFGILRSSLAILQDSADTLGESETFNSKAASFNDSTALIPQELGEETPTGDYTFDVSTLATAHSIAVADSNAFSSPSDVVGKGTLTFTFGNWSSDFKTFDTSNTEGSPATITIDDSNNSLNGLKDAINDADIGVQASIVDDGTNGYKLVLRGPSGANNEMRLEIVEDGTTAGDAANTDASGLSVFSFVEDTDDNVADGQLTELEGGQDAAFTVNGLSVTRSSNQIDDVVEGFKFTLSDDSADPFTINVTRDTLVAEDAVRGFVDAFNTFLETVEPLMGFNEAEEEGEEDFFGSLHREPTSRAMLSSIRNAIASSVTAVTGDFTALTNVGIRTELDGTLTINEDDFRLAFDENFDLVKELFSPITTSSSDKITVNGFGEQTVPGAYEVVITQDPEQGFLTGAAVTIDGVNDPLAKLTTDVSGYLTGAAPDSGLLNDLVGSQGYLTGAASAGTLLTDLTTAGANDYDFTIDIDGVTSGTVSLTPGTYADNDALAAHIQTQINADATLSGAGKSVSVSHDGTGFVVTSATLGSTSTVNSFVAVGASAGDLGLGGGSSTVGADTAADAYDFSLAVDGVTSGTISLTPGVYADNDALAAHIQTQINADVTLSAASKTVTVTHDGTAFVVTSDTTGITSTVDTFTAIGTNASGLGLDSGTSTAGATGSGDYDFTITVNGTESGTISLSPGSYADYDALASHIQSQINADQTLKDNGADVTVTWDGAEFVITSGNFGAKSSVSVTAVGADAADLGLAAGTSTAGKDTAGTVGGETGFGVGNVLLPKLDSDPYGLSFIVEAGATSSTINFSRGFGGELSQLIDSFLESGGVFADREESLNTKLDALEDDEDQLDRRMEGFHERMMAQFQAMERIINSLNQSGDMLDGILDRLPFTAKQG